VRYTLQVHEVIGLSEGGIAVKDTTCFSCFYDACSSNGLSEPVCEEWTIYSMNHGQVNVREYRRGNQ
jgi:hypothetical protein